MKYKHTEVEDWCCTIDDNGNKSQSWNKKNRPGYYEEMQAWVKAGNVIEPQFTAKELKQKKEDDLQDALDSQKVDCIKKLRESDYKFLEDFEYPEDLASIKADRLEWKRIIKSDILETIP